MSNQDIEGSVPADATPAAPPRRGGPWRALALLAGLAVVAGIVAWGSMEGADVRTAREAPAASVALARASPPGASTALATAAPAPTYIPSGAVALPPLTPEAQLAAAPTAAGPAQADMAGRLRKALDGEGIVASVEVDAATGHVVVADPKADVALRDRTDMLIRAVFAGAGAPEPQIEHRWLSPMRAALATQPEPDPAPDTSGMTAAQAYAARHAAPDHAAERRKTASTLAVSEELRPVLPEGRTAARCRASLAGKAAHRADMTACMAHSCCSTGVGQSEDCRAYQKVYPFTCSAG